MPTHRTLAVLSAATAALLAAGARANSAPAGCPVGTHSLPSTCFVVGGATFLDGGPKNLTLDECCSACGARRNDPEGERCLGMQWNEAGNAWGSQNRSGCARADTTCCFLFGSAPAVKKPMHPAQQRCESALMPLPPAPPWPATPPAGAKNILHVLVDDLRTQMTPYGTAGQHAFMHTPHFAAFADTAVQFEQAHCNSQMCVPTRNSFMTGRRPDTTRVFNDGIGAKHFRITGPDWTSLPQTFKEAGYFVTGVGKSFHPNLPPNFDQPKSWTGSINASSGGGTTGLPYFYPKVENCPATAEMKPVWCEITNSSAVFEDSLILTEGQRRLALAVKLQRPFFLAVGFHKPHTPYRAPSRFFDLYPPAAAIAIAKDPAFPTDQGLTGLAWFSCKAEGNQYPINQTAMVHYDTHTSQLLRRAYYASVSFTDWNIGQLLASLTASGAEKETVVVMHADHGYQLGERNIWCKETNFNLATHVPLFIRAAGMTSGGGGGRKVSAIVELVDVMPTMLDLAGLPAFDHTRTGEPPIEGRSLAPLVLQSSPPPSLPGDKASDHGFNVSYSQYGRARCPTDLFTSCVQADPEDPEEALQHYIGYSVRTYTHRYTRWVVVTIAGVPTWDPAIGEELYFEDTAGGSDDFDTSETVNLVAHPVTGTAQLLTKMRALLVKGFPQAHGAGEGGAAGQQETAAPRLKNDDDGRSEDQECSLNGHLSGDTAIGNATCVCNQGWQGAECHLLKLPKLSASFTESGTYGRTPNVTSWGATLVQDASDEAYHLFLTEEQLGCGMTSWKQNSAIVHAVSSTPGKGAFKRVGLSIPFATNPAVHWDAKAKLWRMLVIKTGGPASKQHHCGPKRAGGDAEDETQDSAQVDVGANDGNGTHQLYSTPDLKQNWTLTVASFPGCNNPTGAVDKAGTAWLLCHNGPGFHLYSAAAGWTAQATGWIAHGNVLRACDGVRAGSCEDPSMWIDPSSGAFHVLAHCYSTTAWNGTEDGEFCAAHLFSNQPTNHSSWGFHGGATMAPYGFDGTLSTRERPTLTLGADGSPAFLTNGVAALGFNRQAKHRDWAFTLIQGVMKTDDDRHQMRNLHELKYTAKHGAITIGGDLGKENMTTAQAEKHCTSLQDCVGFTFSCAKPGGNCTTVDATSVYPIEFKRISSDNSDSAWWTYLKLPSDVVITIDTSLAASHAASPLVMGCHSDSGYTHQPRGFYSQMVVGASFEAAVNGIVPPIIAAASTLQAEHGAPQRIYWNNLTTGTAIGHAKLSNATQFHGESSMCLSFAKGGTGFVGVTNRGLGNEGLVFETGKPYDGFLFASSVAAATLEVSLRGTATASGVALATTTLHHPGGGQWLRFNFSLTPSASTSCVNMSAADAMSNGGSVDCKIPGMHGMGRDHACVKCGGEIAVGLSAPGDASIDYVFLQPGPWARLGTLPVLASTIKAMKAVGVTAIRQGGSFTDPSYYFWKRWTGPAWLRPSISATWGSSLEAGWGPFEFIDMCEAAGILPVVTTTAESTGGGHRVGVLPACCAPEDMADLIEYTWGNSTTKLGQQRIADGHPSEYKLQYIELGNEQYNSAFVDQVIAMEQRAKQIGKPAFFNYIFPSNLGLNATDRARVTAAGLDETRILADWHVGYGGAVEDAASMFATNGAAFKGGAVNLETNAATHTMQRALAEASDIGDFLGSAEVAAGRMKIRTASFCTERSGHFDSFDQGLIFFLPNQTWLQPPAHAHAMIHDSWADRVLRISYGRALGQSATAQMQSDGSRLVVRYANAYNTSVKVSLSGVPNDWHVANVTVLKPPTDADACMPHCSGSYYDRTTPALAMCCSNPPGNPSLVAPAKGSMDGAAAFTASPYSFTVVQFTKV